MKIKICDQSFLHHTQSAFVGGDAIGMKPRNFEWEFAPASEARFVTDAMIKYVEDGAGKVAWLLEPFSLHPEDYIAAMSRNFDAVLTHNRYFAQNFGWMWYPHGGTLVAENDVGIRQKTKDVSILISPKNTTQGHKLRHDVAFRFRDRIDIFGLDERIRPVDAYGPYRYSVVIENERAEGYFTERLIDCLSFGTIPIYWGCPDILETHFLFGGVIEFQTLLELDDIIPPLLGADGIGYYERNVVERNRNLEIARMNVVCEDYIYRAYPGLFEGG